MSYEFAEGTAIDAEGLEDGEGWIIGFEFCDYCVYLVLIVDFDSFFHEVVCVLPSLLCDLAYLFSLLSRELVLDDELFDFFVYVLDLFICFRYERPGRS